MKLSLDGKKVRNILKMKFVGQLILNEMPLQCGTNVSPEDVVLNDIDESTPEDADLSSYIQPDKDSPLDLPLEILQGPLVSRMANHAKQEQSS